jgi:hypothetical protein
LADAGESTVVTPATPTSGRMVTSARDADRTEDPATRVVGVHRAT